MLNTYIPYQYTHNKQQYFENLWNINAFVETIHNTNFMIIGDWNANLSDNDNFLFRYMMLNFCCENYLKFPQKTCCHPTLKLISKLQRR